MKAERSEEPEQEIFQLVDRNGIQTGTAARRECHSNPQLIHMVVHLHIFDGMMRCCARPLRSWELMQKMPTLSFPIYTAIVLKPNMSILSGLLIRKKSLTGNSFIPAK
ncbi:hypothetical protein ES703_55469 [subsurface metagenome]